jgi:hypothetical protein
MSAHAFAQDAGCHNLAGGGCKIHSSWPPQSGSCSETKVENKYFETKRSIFIASSTSPPGRIEIESSRVMKLEEH